MYTIGKISEMFNIPASTLRYYDKEGLFPDMKRTSGIRKFSDRDIEALRVIECLKLSGLESGVSLIANPDSIGPENSLDDALSGIGEDPWLLRKVLARAESEEEISGGASSLRRVYEGRTVCEGHGCRPHHSAPWKPEVVLGLE